MLTRFAACRLLLGLAYDPPRKLRFEPIKVSFHSDTFPPCSKVPYALSDGLAV